MTPAWQNELTKCGGGAAGNQQDSRIFQRLLEFMSDTAHRGLIIFLAATNRPDLMERRPAEEVAK
jgi:SpoVK/Ycf46/Vps4 family AAA+-type ATPase